MKTASTAIEFGFDPHWETAGTRGDEEGMHTGPLHDWRQDRTASQKPLRGSYALEREHAEAKEDKRREGVRKQVRKRDGNRCRWPELHKCRGPLECIHWIDASRGGSYESSNLWLGCRWIHRGGPESIHSKDLRAEPDTPKGCDGNMSFWRRENAHRYVMVKREIGVRQYERD